MATPVVAIVGRPNVGKSSLFNWLAGRRIAIVDPTAGVTRDRLSTLVQDDQSSFELMDTGGMGIEDVDDLTAQVEGQIEEAIRQAALLLFVVDVRSGLMPLDEDVAGRLRNVTCPVILVANKCDMEALDPQTAEFHKLGFGSPVLVSAHQNRGREELLSRIRDLLPETDEIGSQPEEATLKLAIVGRRNTGKSTFINCLAQGERVIVSEVPGTTRDSVDVRFERDGKVILAIDTAGVRRKSSVATDIEFYSMARAERSIRRADVVLHLFDARQSISKVDKQLAGYILDHFKPAIFVANKWDLMTALPTERFGNYVHANFPSLDFVPIAFITAKSGKNVQMLLNLAQQLHKQASARVSTRDLNRVLQLALEQQAPPMRLSRRPKVFYGTQAGIHPPTIVLFTNGPELFDNTYQRYLTKTFRDHLPFTDIPIKLCLRRRQRPDGTSLEDRDDQAGAASLPAERPSQPPPKKTKRPARPAKTDQGGRGLAKPKESELWKDL